MPAPEPPPLAPDAPRTLAATLDAAHAYVTRYVVCPSPHEPVAVVLWIAHAWAVDAAETSPYLAVTSAEKRSGKTRLLDVLEQLAPRPWRAVTPSEAVVFRKLAQDHPTLLLDEVDAIFGTKRQADSNEGLRAILNAGNRRGTTVPRVVGEGKRMRVEDFAVFGPKAIAGIGPLPDTVADRSIPVRLERRARSEPVARFRIREAEPAALPIRDALEAHLARSSTAWRTPGRTCRTSSETAPRTAGSRCWPSRTRPAGTGPSAPVPRPWPCRGTAPDDLDDAPASILLLADCRDIFDRRGADRLMTAQLLEDLAGDDERPWRDWRDGKPMSAHGLGRLLRGYQIKPDQLKFVGVQGPRLSASRLRARLGALPTPPVQTPQSVTPLPPSTTPHAQRTLKVPRYRFGATRYRR